jgi:WD40 repeat protein
MAGQSDQPDRKVDPSGEKQLAVGRRDLIIAAVLGVVAIGAVIAIGVRAPDSAPEENAPEVNLFPHVQEFRTGPLGAVHAVATAELDGRPVIVAGGENATVAVWDLATRAPIGQPFTGHNGAVNAIAIGQLEGRPVVVTGSDDGTARVWDLATGTAIGRPFTGDATDVLAVAIAQLDGLPVIVTGSSYGPVQVWDMTTGAPIGQPIIDRTMNPLTDHTVNAIAIAQLDGRSVVLTGGRNYTVRVWDLATGAPIGQPLEHETGVNAVATAQLDGRPVILSSDGGDYHGEEGDEPAGTIQVWDLATGAPIGQPFTGVTDPDVTTFESARVRALAVAQLDGRPVVVSGSGDATVRVWDLATRAPIGQPLTGPATSVLAVATAELDGRPVVVSGCWDATVRVWDLATGAPIGQPFTGHTGEVRAVAIAQLDGRPVVVSGSRDATVRVWDLATSAPIRQLLTERSGEVREVAIAQLDGRPVVVSDAHSERMRIWDLTDARTDRTVTDDSDSGYPNAIATGQLDGRPVIVTGGRDTTLRVTGDYDFTLRVWDLATGAPISQPLTGHTSGVNAVVIAQLDGRPIIVSGSADTTIRAWRS